MRVCDFNGSCVRSKRALSQTCLALEVWLVFVKEAGFHLGDHIIFLFIHIHIHI